MTILGAAIRTSPFTWTGRVLRLPLRLVPHGLVVPILAGVNRRKYWVVGSTSTHSSWIGTYERDHAAALARLIRPGVIAYDVGANAGYYSLALSSLVGLQGRVFCFEPEARNMAHLRRHIQLNRVENATLVQAAVSGAAGLVGFAAGSELGHIAGGNYLIPSLSLDEFIACGNPSPDFVKLDIEGAEKWALAGASGLLEQRRATWMIATHSPELRVHCAGVFTTLGYRLAAFDGATPPGDAADFLAFPPALQGR